MEARFRIRKALDADWPSVSGLLAACGLPTSGIEQHLAEGYIVAADGDRPIGVAGIETHGGSGLLRSVAVLPVWRGRSVGRQLVRDRLAWAQEAGLTDVYLLTTDAAGYFEQLGFSRVDRDAVPDGIRTSDEFASLCPKSATVMALRGGKGLDRTRVQC